MRKKPTQITGTYYENNKDRSPNKVFINYLFNYIFVILLTCKFA